MNFAEARFRTIAYFVVDWLLRIVRLSVYVIAWAKGVYKLVGNGCSIAANLCGALQNLIAYVVNNCPFFSWLWVALPDVPPEQWYLVLFSGVGLSALFLFLFTFYLGWKRRKLMAALADAEHLADVEAFHPTLNRQSARNLSAGRDINLDQTINNYLGGWDKEFSNRPLGQIIIGAAGSLLAFLLGRWLTN